MHGVARSTVMMVVTAAAIGSVVGVRPARAAGPAVGGGEAEFACPRPDGAERADEAGAGAGSAILSAGRKIVEAGRIFKGSCFDFVSAVFRNAGYPEKRLQVVFRRKPGGRFADASLLRPGDWMMHINHEYKNVEHSVIFVCWVDRKRRLAQTLGYVGERRAATGSYRPHDLTEVFRVLRAPGLALAGGPEPQRVAGAEIRREGRHQPSAMARRRGRR